MQRANKSNHNFNLFFVRCIKKSLISILDLNRLVRDEDMESAFLLSTHIHTQIKKDAKRYGQKRVLKQSKRGEMKIISKRKEKGMNKKERGITATTSLIICG